MYILDRKKLRSYLYLIQERKCCYCNKNIEEEKMDLHELFTKGSTGGLSEYNFFLSVLVCRNCHIKIQNDNNINNELIRKYIISKLKLLNNVGYSSNLKELMEFNNFEG